MVSCGQYKMLPMAPTSVMGIPPSSKPKIGFSIESIVGNHELRDHLKESSLSPRSESPERPSSSLSDCSFPLELRNSDFQQSVPNQDHRLVARGHPALPTEFHRNFGMHFLENSSSGQDILEQARTKSVNSPLTVQTPLSPEGSGRSIPRTPSPPAAHHQPASKGPIVVPGIPAGLIRPFPVQHQNLAEMKPAMPQYLNPQDVVGSANPHFLAAQFQMAAALAHGQAGQGFPPGAGMPQHHPQFTNPNIVRDSYPLYPWLLSRHGRIFPHRFPGNFLLQPFRKPKRVRTAFSPSQLLKLEHAFENNHYVVGAERKALAQALSLTETQVKVWFQNRRTKHKRMQQEEDAKGGGGGGSSGNGGDQKNLNDQNSSSQSYEEEDEDELIDMDDCPSDQETDHVP